MSNPGSGRSRPDDRASFGELYKTTVLALRSCQEQPELMRDAIVRYVCEAYRLRQSAAEVVDAFCVSTPNIVESAGYRGAAGDLVVARFDELHDEFRRAGFGG